VDGSALKVFKYTLSGSLLGSWAIDAADTHPTGITINPTSVSDVWIVDSGTLKVYDYAAAAGRTSGSQAAAATFALAPGDTNPVGIADPPPSGLVLTPAAAPFDLEQSSVPVLNAATAGGGSAVPGFSSVAGRDAVFALLSRQPLPRSGEPALNLLTGAALAPWLDNPTPAADRAAAPGVVSSGPKVLDPSNPLTPENSQGLRLDRSAVGQADGPWADEESPAPAAATDAFFAGLAEDAPAEE
jgi:hypothetical protein